MLYGECPFLSDNVDEVYQLIKLNKYTLDNKMDSSANDLIKRLLVHNYQERAGYQEVMDSDFMKNNEKLPETLPLNTLMHDPTMSFLTKYSDHLGPEMNVQI